MEVEVRAPRPNEVRMRHAAIGLNYVEVVQRSGRFRSACHSFQAMKGRGSSRASALT